MHIGYSFFFSWGIGRQSQRFRWQGPRGVQHPSPQTSPPLFWHRIERGGEWAFQLCPCGERIKLCGRAAWRCGELLGYVIVSILTPTAPQICAAPAFPKRNTWPGRGELIKRAVLPRGARLRRTWRQKPRVWLTAVEGRLKDMKCGAARCVCALK